MDSRLRGNDDMCPLLSPLSPPPMDSRLRGNDGEGVAAKDDEIKKLWISACAGMTAVKSVWRPVVSMDSRLRGNDGLAWVLPLSWLKNLWIPACAGMTAHADELSPPQG